MSTVAVTRTIDVAPARVWAFITDLANRGAWLSSVDAVEVLTTGAFDAGAAWRESRTIADGTRVTEEFRVDQCEPPRAFVVSSAGIGATYRITYTVNPVEVGRHRGGSTVTIEQEGHASGTTGRVLEWVLGGLAARAVEGALWQELDDLARALTTPRSDTGTAA
jgi:uncharacterized protein YndB with AHSA1/START domain